MNREETIFEQALGIASLLEREGFGALIDETTFYPKTKLSGDEGVEWRLILHWLKFEEASDFSDLVF